jgi:hypothetical protein
MAQNKNDEISALARFLASGALVKKSRAKKQTIVKKKLSSKYPVVLNAGAPERLASQKPDNAPIDPILASLLVSDAVKLLGDDRLSKRAEVLAEYLRQTKDPVGLINIIAAAFLAGTETTDKRGVFWYGFSRGKSTRR